MFFHSSEIQLKDKIVISDIKKKKGGGGERKLSIHNKLDKGYHNCVIIIQSGKFRLLRLSDTIPQKLLNQVLGKHKENTLLNDI